MELILTFVLCDDENYEVLQEEVTVDFWEKPNNVQTIARICTSWSTTDEELKVLCEAIENEV